MLTYSRTPILTAKSRNAIKTKQRGDLAPDPNPYKVPTDAIEFIRSCRIRTGKGFQRFDLYDYQIELLKLIIEHQSLIIIKDRQLGITEVLAAYSYWQCLTDPAYSAAFISINQDKSAEISDRIDGMAPSNWGVEWAKNNASELRPVRAGVMRFLPSTKSAARGLPAVNFLAFDEAGFLDHFADLYGNGTAAQESVPPDRRKTILNTTIPEEGQAHPVWGMFAADNDDGYAIDAIHLAREGGTSCGIPGMVHWVDQEGCCKVVIGHKVHPIYGKDPNYIETVKKRRKIPNAIAQREHNLGIEIAGASLFHQASIERQSTGAWSGYVEGRRYMLMIDPNFGGGDNYVGLVFDITSPIASLVAEYAESDRSTDYSRGKILGLADEYKIIALAIESNSGGKIIWENIQRDRPDLNSFLTVTSHQSKILNTDRVALALEQGEFSFPDDWGGKREMVAFSATKRCAVSGEKDDRVMALAAGFAHIDAVRLLDIQEFYLSGYGMV
jgi:hypothetical protein